MPTPEPEKRVKRPRLRLPFEKRKQDAGSWTYDHRIGLCVTCLLYTSSFFFWAFCSAFCSFAVVPSPGCMADAAPHSVQSDNSKTVRRFSMALLFAFHLDLFVSLDDVADTDIVERFDVQAAVLAGRNLLDVVLEALERTQLAGVRCV